MKARKHVLPFALGIAMVLTCNIFSVHAAANLVVTKVFGPAEAFVNQTISVSYSVKNKGDAASEGYEVGLYLSSDNTIDPAVDVLLKKVSFPNGLTAGRVRATTTKVIVPNYYLNGLSGNHYFGAIVESSKKASSKPVAIARYSLGDDNDSVTDHKTGLIWQRADDGVERTWSEAEAYCQDLVLGGHDDWSLPPAEVLVTIVDYSRIGPAIDPVFNCRSSNYWSSSPNANDPDYAWGPFFYRGYVGQFAKSSNFYVRCVRVGP